MTGCNKDGLHQVDEMSYNIDFRQQTNGIPNFIKDKINDKWYHFSSQYRANIYKNFGDINYDRGLDLSSDKNITQHCFSVPFIKDGQITAITIYIDDSEKDFEFLDFITIDQILSKPVKDWGIVYEKGLLELVVEQLVTYQYLLNNNISIPLLEKLNEIKNFDSVSLESRCITQVWTHTLIVQYTYDNTQNGDIHGGIVTAIGTETTYEVVFLPCHEPVNIQVGVDVVFPIITDLNTESKSYSTNEFAKCKQENISPIFDGFIDELLEEGAISNINFPCLSESEEKTEKERLKNQAYVNWCFAQKDKTDKNL